MPLFHDEARTVKVSKVRGHHVLRDVHTPCHLARRHALRPATYLPLECVEARGLHKGGRGSDGAGDIRT
jgi:hypothetical protein